MFLAVTEIDYHEEEEGCDINNVYLFINLYIPIRMRKPTDSSQQIAFPGYDCLLINSLYGARQSGKIWGNRLNLELT